MRLLSKIILKLTILIFLTLQFAKANAQIHSIKILTINVWSGLDYNGFFKVGEYETEEKRELRYQSLLSQIKNLNPDVLFIQEANPVAKYTARLANDLGFDEIHQVCNAGIKFGPVGPPQNMKEGIAILCRKSLQLEMFDVWKLSGSFGIYGDIFTIHFDESIFAIAGKIIVQNKPLYLINVHLNATPSFNPELQNELSALYADRKIAEKVYQQTLEHWKEGLNRKKSEIERLVNKIQNLGENISLIVGGDFNLDSNDSTLQQFQNVLNLTDFFSENQSSNFYTWEPHKNDNIKLSIKAADSTKIITGSYDWLTVQADKQPALIDHIFLSPQFRQNDISENKIVLDSQVNGFFPSDHYGIVATINLENALRDVPQITDTVSVRTDFIFEPLPIISYDTDAGFGYGAKGFLLNFFGFNESLDLILFNSTEGERWYRMVFSVPDFELRQGKIYPFAVDLTVDFDKWISYKFYGIGNQSKYDDEEIYTRKPLEISLTASRGFSKHFVAQLGLRYKTIENSNFEKNSNLKNLPPELNHLQVNYLSGYASIRYDTRNSFINPSRGIVLQGESELAPEMEANDVNFSRLSAWFQYYSRIFYPNTVFAFRLGVQSLSGENLPVQVLLPIGGNNTLRGFPQDRFLDNASVMINSELRFPIYSRLGGIIGWDTGRVFGKVNQFSFSNWHHNPLIGLRYYFDTFIVRLDVGFGKDTLGFYLNFGHIF